MIALASEVLLVAAVVLALPSLVFTLEIAAAIAGNRRDLQADARRGRLAVLVPAHNEAEGLLPTLEDLKRQLRSSDRLVVIADNCTDETASIAAAAGAEVTIRHDLSKIGKGYALDWGLRHLEQWPPDIVLIVDADCRISPGAIDRLAALSEQTARPVQALYLMNGPKHSGINQQVATFAWRVKNFLRPLGLQALGLPCQLMGTGMAFPWKLLRCAELSSGAIVEDLQLGLDLALAGRPPLFCPSATVSSTFSQTKDGVKAQRERWEHGHIGLMGRGMPLVVRSLKLRDLSLLALALDLLVPPLALLALMLFSLAATSAIVALFGGSPAPLLLSVASLSAVGVAITLAWMKCARDILPPRKLGLIPLYILSKLPLYFAALFGHKVSRWVRTDRANQDGTPT